MHFSTHVSKHFTCEVLLTLASVASLSAAAPAVVATRPRVAQIDLRLTVISGEAGGATAAEAVDGVYRPEEHGVGRDEGRRAVEAQHRDTLHVVLTRLPQADVVIKGQHLMTKYISGD